MTMEFDLVKPSNPAANESLKLPDVFPDRLKALASLPKFSPEALIDQLKTLPHLAYLYAQPAVREGYSIEEHTLMILRQFEKYFAEIELPQGISRTEMRLMLALHDIGKGIPSDRKDQHSHTLDVIASLQESGLFTDDTYRLITAVISGDPLGEFIRSAVVGAPSIEEKLLLAQQIARGENSREPFDNWALRLQAAPCEQVDQAAEIAAAKIRAMAVEAGVLVGDILKILTIYYQCDVSTYTYDAPRDPGRSKVLAEDDVGAVKFNDDRLLREIPKLESNDGDRSWHVYARLEHAARSTRIQAFPISRGYPSLDFLFELRPDFNPVDSGTMFSFDPALDRLQFAKPVERAFELLAQRITESR